MLRLFWFILFHLLGLACIAADVAIVGSMGRFNLEWTGWLAIGFYWWLAVGVAMGWKRFVGRPIRLIILGFYVMATFLLLGLGFSQRMSAPSLLLAFAPLATALAGRIILDIVTHARKPKAKAAPAPPPQPRTVHDTLFKP